MPVDKFNNSLRSWALQLANVQNWMPSRRPKYMDTRTGTVYRLDKVDGCRVWLTKDCGSKRRFSTAEFENWFKRV